MGKKGVEILTLDVKSLIDVLNQALAEEWLAYYQYWVGARVMKGPMHDDIEKELLKHADEELDHAKLLIDRIIQLDGTPVLSPEEWFKLAHCKYLPPVDPNIEAILKQNLGSERCAIQRYEDIANFTNGKDFTTFNIATHILQKNWSMKKILSHGWKISYFPPRSLQSLICWGVFDEEKTLSE